ncbi:hypothetical protein [Streptomyces formicae]
MIANLIRRRREWRGLRLWPVGIVLFLAFATALAVAAGVFFAGWDLLGANGLERQRRIDAATLFDLVKFAFGAAPGAGARELAGGYPCVPRSEARMESGSPQLTVQGCMA